MSASQSHGKALQLHQTLFWEPASWGILLEMSHLAWCQMQHRPLSPDVGLQGHIGARSTKRHRSWAWRTSRGGWHLVWTSQVRQKVVQPEEMLSIVDVVGTALMATEVIPVDLEVAWSLQESCSPRDLGLDAVQSVWPSWGTRNGSISIHQWESSEEMLHSTQAHPGPSTRESWRCCEAAWQRAGRPAILPGHLQACHQHVCKPCRQCAQRQGI